MEANNGLGKRKERLHANCKRGSVQKKQTVLQNIAKYGNRSLYIGIVPFIWEKMKVSRKRFTFHALTAEPKDKLGEYLTDLSRTCLEKLANARARVTCKIPSANEIPPGPTSLSTVQLHMPNGNFFVPTATLVTVTFCFHNSALSSVIPDEAFHML